MKLGHPIAFMLIACSVGGYAEAATPPVDGLPASAPAVSVRVDVDASHVRGPLVPIWRFFGYDECNFTYMPRGQQLLDELAHLAPDQPQVYVRCHHLLTSGDGTPGMKWGSTGVYSENAQGEPIYNWTVVDRIFDTYQQHGLMPYAQIGFMPKDLSTRPDLYPGKITSETRVPVDGGQAYPPKDYAKWGQLVNAWVSHCVQRYGAEAVRKWYWEVWNEPNISYWKGTPQQYDQLYDVAAAAVKRAAPQARVGGPETAGSAPALRSFLQHCAAGAVADGAPVPLDFVSFHAKGQPRWVNDHVRMGIAPELRVIDSNFAAVAAFPQFRHLPVIIGECDPDGMAARPVSENRGLGYRNSPQFASYTAAVFTRAFDLADRHGVNFQGALTWSFEFENKPYFAGYRVLASNGIDLPILNLFRMLARMSGNRVAVRSSSDPGLDTDLQQGVEGSAGPEVYALAATTANQAAVLLYHYQDDDVPGSAAQVQLTLNHLPRDGAALLTQYRIDRSHGDAYTLWQQMGEPQNPTPAQYERLKQSGQLAEPEPPADANIHHGTVQLAVSMPRQSVALLLLNWK